MLFITRTPATNPLTPTGIEAEVVSMLRNTGLHRGLNKAQGSPQGNSGAIYLPPRLPAPYLPHYFYKTLQKRARQGVCRHYACAVMLTGWASNFWQGGFAKSSLRTRSVLLQLRVASFCGAKRSYQKVRSDLGIIFVSQHNMSPAHDF